MTAGSLTFPNLVVFDLGKSKSRQFTMILQWKRL